MSCTRPNCQQRRTERINAPRERDLSRAGLPLPSNRKTDSLIADWIKIPSPGRNWLRWPGAEIRAHRPNLKHPNLAPAIHTAREGLHPAGHPVPQPGRYRSAIRDSTRSRSKRSAIQSRKSLTGVTRPGQVFNSPQSAIC